MPLLTTEISQESTDIIEQQISSGSYKDSAEVVESALQLLKREDEDVAWKEWELSRAIQEGIDSPDAEGNIFDQIRAELGLPPRAARA